MDAIVLHSDHLGKQVNDGFLGLFFGEMLCEEEPYGDRIDPFAERQDMHRQDRASRDEHQSVAPAPVADCAVLLFQGSAAEAAAPPRPGIGLVAGAPPGLPIDCEKAAGAVRMPSGPVAAMLF